MGEQVIDNVTEPLTGQPSSTGGQAHEYSALEAVPARDRNMNFFDMLMTWVGANANNGSWYIGGVVAGAAVGGAVLVTLVANPIAYLIMALVGFVGYKVGTSTMSLTRPSFGVRGSFLPSLLSIVQFVGWTAVNTFIAAISISYMMHGWFKWPAFGSAGSLPTMLFGIGVMSVLHLVAISVGHRSVKVIEKIGVVLILILGVWETWAVLSHVSLGQIFAWHPPTGDLMPLGSAMDAMAAFSLGWVPAIAEFTRYCKTRGSATVAPMIGANLALFWFIFVGMIGTVAVAITSHVYDPNNSDPSSIVEGLGLGPIALLVIVITSTTANAVNLMGAGLAVTNFTRRIKSMGALWLVTGLSILLTLVPLILGNFLDLFTSFLDFIGLTYAPVFGIMIVDFYLTKRRSYLVAELDRRGGRYWYSQGFHLPALLVWVAAVVINLLINSLPLIADTTGATYPLMLLAALAYYLICRGEEKRLVVAAGLAQ